LSDTHTRRQGARRTLTIVGLLVLLGAVLLWRYTPLAAWADPQRVAAVMQELTLMPWGLAIVVAVFIVGGFIAFPLTLLIAATAVVFDVVTALIVSVCGALGSALALYAVGHTFMRATVNHAFGNQVAKLQSALEHRGIMAVATIRMVPIAPFTLVNLIAGSLGVRFRDYTLGTLIGVLPGTLALTAFGRQARHIIEHPTATNVALLLVVIGAWIGLSLALQRLVARRKSNKE
jgi:phospholipase D1/2